LSQGAQFFLYTISTVILARLLSPEDYGLVGMVTAATGFLRVFKDAGLSTATVQRESVTRELVSTVFWINIGLSAAITLLSVALGPVLVAFYREPRLYGITTALAALFAYIIPYIRYRDRRLLVLYFDVTALPPPDLLRACAAARKYIDTQMGPADLLAIMTFQQGAVRVRQDFTDNRAQLHELLQILLFGDDADGDGIPDPLPGAAFGLGLAQIVVSTFRTIYLNNLPQLVSIALDWRVVIFSLLLCLATTFFFGLFPALKATRQDLVEVLKKGGHGGSSSYSSRRLGDVLVVTEMAISLMLILMASLLIQSIARLERHHDRQPHGQRQRRQYLHRQRLDGWWNVERRDRDVEAR
jgi:hypothetical protein